MSATGEFDFLDNVLTSRRLSPEDIKQNTKSNTESQRRYLSSGRCSAMNSLPEKEQLQIKQLNELIGLGAILFLIGAVIVFVSEEEF